MMNWWKTSLASQFITFMLIALFTAQAIGFAIFWSDKQRALRESIQSEFLSRAATLAQVVDAQPTDLRRDVLLASATGYARFWISASEPVDTQVWFRQATAQLQEPLPNLISLFSKRDGDRDAEGHSLEREWRGKELARTADSVSNWAALPVGSWPLSTPARYLRFSNNDGIGMAVQLKDGTWLNAASYKAIVPDFWRTQTLLSIVLTVTIIALIGIFIANRIAKPLRALSQSAEALGRGESISILPETGPDDIRNMCAAFNRMQLRLRRFVDDRTRMLAAISHDLRTPLTTLRLRTEFVADEELQQKMLNTIDEIQTMTEASLVFAKGEATVEQTRPVDLNALVESLCSDLKELGHNVKFIDGEKIIYRCRPDGLRRAVRNLIENAARYGGEAFVRLQPTPTTIDIIVNDSGPGIPEEEIEQVFAPFYRLERSRNRETGGVGLGLSIARAIVRHHGGDIELTQNNPGLRAAVVLPKA
ncbi:signal transduction histidine kinase [Phyllobacterium sp. YR531]|nr:signal transduction histidine kinase [Phyllobacterium sp. YR531]